MNSVLIVTDSYLRTGSRLGNYSYDRIPFVEIGIDSKMLRISFSDKCRLQELLEEVGEYDESIDQSLHDTYGEDGEHDNTIDVFVVYAPTSNYDEEEVEAFYMDLERFYREDHTFFKVIIGDFNAKIGPRRSSEERHIGTHGLEWNEQGDNFDLNIVVRSKSGGSNETYDRLSFSLIGYNEQEVRAAAVTRMTAYTFKETASELRGRFARSNPEPSFIEIFNDDRGEPVTSAYNGQTYPVEELVESQQIDERSVESNGMITNVERIAPTYLKGDGRGPATQPQSVTKRDMPSKPPSLESDGGRQKKVANSANIGLVSRFNLALGDAMDCTEMCDNSELLSSYESINTRPEMTVLPPIMLMPSVDPEVVQMQKELLMRQLRLQRMQEKVLQAQLNSFRIPIARFEELDPNGERVQILADGGEDFMGEPVDEEHELNVMNSGDESGDEILHVESR
uniref:Endo/exonuclease/phosphatase domain-containing protein n=1 Tax=Angiostrongylus cantonensis TaxID=6313 RepID=A0A0K0CUC6_ANGCA